MTSQTIVKMEGISKAFAGIKALDNVQIDLRQGEIHALMGENGAGKSTLMKIMTGVYSRDSGKMYLQNTSSQQLEEVEIKSPLAAQKLGLSMVFQEFNQCVEIAKALSFHARVVVFDEPTASLSEKESQTLFKLIKDLKAKGVCIVYISHRMEEVFELSDRITVFRNGKYIDTVNTKDVQEKDIISMMIGHELNIEKNSGSELFLA